MRNYVWGALVAAAAFAAAPASAENVIFRGNILSSCLLVVNPAGGVLAAGADLKSLSSKNLGGLAGVVAVTTTGGVTFSVSPTVSATGPDAASIIWAPTYTSVLLGATDKTAPTAIGTPTVADVSVNLSGTKPGAAVFAPGEYEATVTVTCG